MKNLILLCVMVSLFACVKVQKKSDVESEPEVVQQQVQREPVIFQLDETMSLDKDLEIAADEVYLKSNTKIFTNQFNLNINAKLIVIESGALIQTFSNEKMKAPFKTRAIDGGAVHIIANEVVGKLQVTMNGQQGGQGIGGWNAYEGFNGGFISHSPHSACAPESGEDSGVSGSFLLETSHSLDFFVNTRMDTAPGGEIGEIHEGLFPWISTKDFNLAEYKARFKNFERTNCNIIPTPGKAGRPGQICMKLSDTDRPTCEKFY